jgi:hypothetical protein
MSTSQDAIAKLERDLLDGLGTPTQQALRELPLRQFTGSPAGLSAGQANQIDPYHLITHVINALDTLGTGQFSGVDPMQKLRGISDAADATSGPLQQAFGSLAHDWQGESGAAAKATTQAAVAYGAQLGAQADGLRNSLSTAASSVAQARQQLIDIIDEFQAKMAATDLSTSSGKRAALAAANQANTEGSAIVQELQDNLGSQAGQVSAIGAPVGGTQAPTAGTSTVAASTGVTPTPMVAASTGATSAPGVVAANGGPVNWLLGPNGLPGAVSAVTSDPRLTPKSIATDFMDLIFLPQTLTQLDQGIMQTNATMAQTNQIMTGLGKTMDTTNSTIGRTNTIMTGLGNTLNTTNSALGQTNAELAPLPGALNTATGAIETTNVELGPGSPLNNNLDNTNTALGHATTAIDNTSKELGPNAPINQNLDTTNRDLHNTDEDLGPNSDLNKNLQDTNTQLNHINRLNPTTWF